MESKKKRTIFIVISILIHILVMVAVIVLTSKSAVGYKGSDTMYHIYRGDWLLNSIKDGDLWPLYNPIWYNGVELMRYWTPLAAYLMALCIQIGSVIPVDSIVVFSGFAVYCGVIYLIGAVSWTIIGVLKKRPYMGLVMGIMWFFMPQSLYVLFTEGNLPRVLIMAVFPLMFHFLNEFLKEGGRGNYIGIVITVFIMCCSHVGYTGMIAIASIIYLVIYRLCVFTGSDRLQRSGKRDLIALTAIVGGFLLCGIFLYPALNGGLVESGADRDETAKKFFQSLFISLDPVGKIKTGYHTAYFGIISFLLAIFGILAGKRRSRAGFITALIIIFCTTETASPIIRSLPGGDLMWMMRFMQIAAAMIVYSMLEWDSLKKPLIIAVTTLLAADCVVSYDLFMYRDGITSMESYFEYKGEEVPLDEAKALTVNRLALMDGDRPLLNGVFYLTDYNGGVNQAFGQGWEAASDASTIAMLNEAFDTGYYDFMFDRLLEIGCDTILLKQGSPKTYPFNDDEAEISAAKAGYSIVLEERGWVVYHLDDVSGVYGTVSEFDGVAIGSGAYYITMMFPSIDEASSEYIDDFTAEELSEYDIIYLDGFDYHDCETAESLIRQVAQNGTEVIVFADGIPENESSRTNRFLGVEAQPVTFDNGYPTLQTSDGRFYEIPLFPDEYKDWSTCYINGLTDVKGWAEILGEPLPFYGTIDCENITFLAYNLTYYYSLTRDRNVGEILADIIPEPEHDIPVRQIVPLEIEYGHNDITITSPEDNVNTTVTEHDIFEGEFDTHKRLVFVGEGTTVIKMHYPHLAMSILMSVSGIAVAILGTILAGKRRSDEDSNNNPVA